MKFVIKICMAGWLVTASLGLAMAQTASETRDGQQEEVESRESATDEELADENGPGITLFPEIGDAEKSDGADGLIDGREPTEEEVHERRLAQLKRLRDLAVENDRRDMISRVDGLIARELKRYSRENGEEMPEQDDDSDSLDDSEDEAEAEANDEAEE